MATIAPETLQEMKGLKMEVTEKKKETLTPANSDSEELPSAIESIQLGVWRLLLLREPSFVFPGASAVSRWKEAYVALPLFRRFCRDVSNLGPTLVLVFLATKVWSGLEYAITLALSERILGLIEAGVTEKNLDSQALLLAVCYQIFFSVVGAIMHWFTQIILPKLKTRFLYYYEKELMRARLRLDLTTLQENTSQSRVTPKKAWKTFIDLIEFGKTIVSLISQLGFIMQLSRANSGGPIFILLCLAKPFFLSFLWKSLRGKTYVVYANDTAYCRKRALKDVAMSDKYRGEIITGNAGDYFLKEYEEATNQLGDISDEYAESQYEIRPTPLRNIGYSLTGILPMMYYVVNSIWNVSTMSVTSIAILEQTSQILRYTLSGLADTDNSLYRQLNGIKTLYDAIDIENKTEDGSLSYFDLEKVNYKGMKVEFRDVTFNYPNSKATAPALSNMSFTINSGDLVVVVGSNGSGKSSMVKLLTRLYDVSSGDILIDGRNIKEYRMATLREVTAILAQDHHLFPLSVSENIGLGDPACMGDNEKILEAAKLGGAYDFVQKLKQGFRTNMYPVKTAYGSSTVYEADKEDPMKVEFEKLEKWTELSGGQYQRLVAARTFMRLNGGGIKLVAVDEPSSALDPEGEFELFQQLRAARIGKTMIFVTHRFGHLTKHADLILCMKDGVLAEAGTHDELINKEGEYHKLYNVQANAFTTTTSIPTPEVPLIKL
ncbi:hypothetical protein JAAARDRAFT_55856 [Jaapia argillacea MUCL 33604]|uniref:ABC transporter domain-containing protein n=1 Tax=Jaapia argillacea MUCL 33604 TaxID=933084 RepID=A0A067Q2E9_9AGAM|nr:hypothetical protein JAAARDRAFT_55856 [Jaapia argillacea MUCL 33604]